MRFCALTNRDSSCSKCDARDGLSYRDYTGTDLPSSSLLFSSRPLLSPFLLFFSLYSAACNTLSVSGLSACLHFLYFTGILQNFPSCIKATRACVRYQSHIRGRAMTNALTGKFHLLSLLRPPSPPPLPVRPAPQS